MANNDDRPIIYSTRIQDNPVPSNLTRSVYDVFIFGDPVQTTVTSDAAAVQEWIDQTYAIHEETGAAYLLVGLETRGMLPQRFDALLLCVDHRCLLFHIFAAENKSPAALKNFLEDHNNRFMGVEVINKRKELQSQLGMGGNLWHGDLKLVVGDGGLDRLVVREYGRAVKKPLGSEVWDRVRGISKVNVHSACVDAFLSWDIGRLHHVN